MWLKCFTDLPVIIIILHNDSHFTLISEVQDMMIYFIEMNAKLVDEGLVFLICKPQK